MPNTLNDQQIQNAKYWYEKVPYTFNGNFILGQNAPIFQVNNVATASKNSKIAIVSDLAPNHLANFLVVINTMGTSRQMATDAFPGNLAPVLTRVGSGFRSTGFLSLGVQNNTGAAVNNYAINYACAVKTLTTADKILRGLPLTARDMFLQTKFQLSNNGLRPLDLDETLKRAFWSQVIDEQVFAYEVDATAGQQTPVDNQQPQSGEILIITSIGVSATAGNGVTLNIDRDQEIGYVSVLADNMSIVNRSDAWIPLTERFRSYLTATTTTNNVEVMITALRVRRSMLIDIMFGMVNATTLTGANLEMFDQVEAGVLV